jgi:hypothetical protein
MLQWQFLDAHTVHPALPSHEGEHWRGLIGERAEGLEVATEHSGPHLAVCAERAELIARVVALPQKVVLGLVIEEVFGVLGRLLLLVGIVGRLRRLGRDIVGLPGSWIAET